MSHKSDLTNLFEHTDCPSDDLLLSYVQHKLSKEESRKIELHLVDCEICNDVIEGMQSGISLEAFKSDVLEINSQSKNVIEPIKVISIIKKKNNFFAIAASLLLLLSLGFMLNYLLNSNSKTHSLVINETPKTQAQPQIQELEEISITVDSNEPNRRDLTPAAPLKSKAPITQKTENQIEEGATKQDNLIINNKKSIDANLSSGQAVFEKAAIAETIDESSAEKDQKTELKDIMIRGARAEETPQNYTIQTAQAPSAVSVQSAKGTTAVSDKLQKFENTDLQKAKSEFNAANYEKAKSLLLTVLNADTSNEEASFYTGKTERMLKNYSNSNTYLKALFEKKKDEFSAEAEWLYALNLVDLKNNSEALIHLKKIAAEGGKFAYPAAEMMSELEK